METALTTNGDGVCITSEYTTGGVWVEPYWPNSVQFHYTYPIEPWTCTGKAHVFECDHEKTCKCGKVTRVMPRAKKAKR